MNRLIKSECLLLVFVLLITVFNSVTVLKPEAAVITTAYIEGTDVRVRETPSSKNDNNILDRISNTTATVLEKKTVSKTEIWYKISYVKNGDKKTGYIFYDDDYIRIVTYNSDADFETKISAFPESYRDALRSLHSVYPNWEFIPDPVKTSFNNAVTEQTKNMRKQVQISSQPVSWRSMGLGSYDWNKKAWVNTNGGWTGASKEIIAYYMDPRNFLNSTEIYMFLEQSYNSAVQNKAGVKKIIAGTFMEKKYTPAKDEIGSGSYLNVIMDVAKKSGVSPYIIASKIKQEQGVKGTSDLISGTYKGYKGYYNFFNIGAYSTDDASVTVNGLKKAKANGWDTRYKSILGGAEFLAKNYIAKGQDTYYYQDFNVHNGGEHQYAQAVHDAYNKGISLTSTYQSDTEFSLSFKIPVYTSMPKKVSAKPTSSSKKNNYYLSEIKVEGLTPSFNMYTYKYNLNVLGNTVIKVLPVQGATIVADSEIKLKKGENTVTVYAKAETGYTNKYTILVDAEKACTLKITSDEKVYNENTSSSSGGSSQTSSDKLSEYTLGDTNDDGKIDIVDLAKVQMHILNLKMLKDNSLKAADTNKDGKIDIIDLAKVQMHILKIKTIGQ